ncbi:MAG: hypothetical protein ACK56I_20380, partial [bacterium]
ADAPVKAARAAASAADTGKAADAAAKAKVAAKVVAADKTEADRAEADRAVLAAPPKADRSCRGSLRTRARSMRMVMASWGAKRC